MSDEGAIIADLLEKGEGGANQDSSPLPSPSSTEFSGKYDDVKPQLSQGE